MALLRRSGNGSIRAVSNTSTAHIACHVGILQRGSRKLDREGRDYWLKPLWEIGAIDKVFFHSPNQEFVIGHPVAKSSNCAYRLSNGFEEILKAPGDQWKTSIKTWIKEDQIRQRLKLQAKLSKEARNRIDTKHSDLIKVSCKYYVPHFLPEYQIIYIDDGDGDRITEEEQRKLEDAGIKISLEDSMPDVLLWNPKTECLWVIEAVTSDGEVDSHKVKSLREFATRNNKHEVGFTTTYSTWASAAKRQKTYKNIQPGTYIWIQEDPSKHFLVESFKTD